MKKSVRIFILLLFLFVLTDFSLAHSGRTDAQGGHRDNKNKSGLGYYHYHHGCPPHLHTGGSCPYGYGNVYDSGNYSSSSNDNYSYSNDSYSSGSSGSSGSSYNYYPKKITIENKIESIVVGEEADVKASIYPSDVEYDDITWSSSNEEIAEVDDYGTITAIKPGTVTISAITENDIVAKMTITIKGIKLEALEISNDTDELTVGDKEYLDLSFIPSNATETEVEWTSSDTSVIIVDDLGCIEAVGEGTAIITASQNDIKAEYAISVYPILKKIELENGENKIRLKRGKTEYIDIEYFPTNVLDKDVEFAINSHDIVEIDDNKIKGIMIGEVTLIAETSNGVTDSIVIEVYSNDIYFALGMIALLGGGTFFVLRRKGIF